MTGAGAVNRARPSDLVLHPVVIGALGLMILNDGWLRPTYGGWLTGKLSDFAVVIFLPAMGAAILSGGRWLAARARAAMRRMPAPQAELRLVDIVVAVATTGAALAAINLFAGATDAYVQLLGALDPAGWFGPFHYTRDPSDLVALPLLAVPWLLGYRMIARARRE